MSNDLINCGELSRLLTGNRQNIRRNKIPDKYKAKVEQLIKLIEQWKKGAGN